MVLVVTHRFLVRSNTTSSSTFSTHSHPLSKLYQLLCLLDDAPHVNGSPRVISTINDEAVPAAYVTRTTLFPRCNKSGPEAHSITTNSDGSKIKERLDKVPNPL